MILWVFLLGCGTDSEPVDGGIDSSVVDTGIPDDTAPPDSSTEDADAGSDDTGITDAEPSDAARPCADAEPCAFGERCRDGFCELLECHPGSLSMDVSARECGDGEICDLLLGSTGSELGVCVAYAPSCSFDGDCAFGFRCAGTCVRSECHAGTDVSLGDYAARPCDTGVCEFGDGVDLNGGRGRCM